MVRTNPTTQPIKIEFKTPGIEIAPAKDLDRIHVYWLNVSLGQGHVTITCWGFAWTAYFGGMSGKTIQEFFAAADVSYLVGKLSRPKDTKKEQAYLQRIIQAVKGALNDAQ